AVRDGDRIVGILSPELTALLPFVYVVLGLFAVRQVLFLVSHGEHPAGIAADALASLALAVLFVAAATRGEIVHLPTETLGQAATAVLEDLVTRVFLLVFLVGALMLTVRFVKRLLRLRERLALG
ncbi:MAG: hypothetical protein ACYTG6_17435, partial [Planctomycetota bacterium]